MQHKTTHSTKLGIRFPKMGRKKGQQGDCCPS